jgi:hypothetical protein
VRRHRGASPGRMMAPSHPCQGVKCSCTGAGACARSAIERGGPRSRAGRTLERGGPRSREAHPLERGRARPRGARILERGGPRSREAHPLERGGARPRGACILERGETYSRESSSGPPGGPLGPSRRGPCPAWLSKAYLVAGFKWGFPSCLRGPLGLSPTAASRCLEPRERLENRADRASTPWTGGPCSVVRRARAPRSSRPSAGREGARTSLLRRSLLLLDAQTRPPPRCAEPQALVVPVPPRPGRRRRRVHCSARVRYCLSTPE